jgi:hypothetical protein
MRRVPMLSGSRLTVVSVPGDTVLLRPPVAIDPIVDVGAAVAEALHYPLAGRSIEELGRRARRATVVVAPGTLPFPGSLRDPRSMALAAILDELERIGVRDANQTILIAGGLERRAGNAELEALLPPARARAFHGNVRVHDVEDEGLEPLGSESGTAIAIARELVDTDLVVTLSAAETVVDGGPATLLGACNRDALRTAVSSSLLETSGSAGWRRAVAVERLVAARAATIGVSLILDNPRASGRLRDYPATDDALDRLARSRWRRLHGMLPDGVRQRLIQGVGRELGVAGVLAGPPSVAHAEALIRGVALRGTALREPVDAIVIGLPWIDAHRPRRRANPITVAATGLGLALRLWRERFPVQEGGTAILLHRFDRAFSDEASAPFHALFDVLRDGADPAHVAAAAAAAATDERAIAAYRSGAATHALLPYADWESCAPALARLGRVIVAGCRDASAARALGFVPSHDVGTALAMAAGVAGGDARVGLALGPPYAPIVGSSLTTA